MWKSNFLHALILLSIFGVSVAFVAPTTTTRTSLLQHHPPTQALSSLSSTTTPQSSDVVEEESKSAIAQAKQILVQAANDKTVDSDTVVGALLDLERLMRQANKADPSQSDATLEALSSSGNGASWRLIFTTGTVDTQKRTGRINYFPIQATQSFVQQEDDDWYIENGIALGDFSLLKFKGDFDWTLQKSGVTKLTFDFTAIKLFNAFEIQLKSGEAANLGAKTGLGSKNNVDLEKKGKRPFFNWISADDQIATARGGGGGLALWKRIEYEGEL